MSRIVSAERIRREPSTVYDFFTTPKNAPLWHPASLSVAGAIDHPLLVGEEFSEELRGPLGVRGHAEWQVTTRDAPRLWRIELKRSAPSPMKATVTLRFRNEKGATVLERDVQYRYGRRWLQLLDFLFLRRCNKKEGNEGLRSAKQRLEAAQEYVRS